MTNDSSSYQELLDEIELLQQRARKAETIHKKKMSIPSTIQYSIPKKQSPSIQDQDYLPSYQPPIVGGQFLMPTNPVIGTGVDVTGIKQEIIDTHQTIIYVHATKGLDANRDGLTWDTALATIPAAVDLLSTYDGDLGVIILSSEEHDIAQADFDLSSSNKLVSLVSAGRNMSSIVNTVSTNYIMEISQPCLLRDLNFEMQSEQHGLKVTSDQFFIETSRLDFTNVTSAVNGIYLNNISRVAINDVVFTGSAAAKSAGSIGILMDGITNGVRITGNIISVLGTGIKIDGSSTLNLIDNSLLTLNTTGIHLTTTTSLNGLQHLQFLKNTQRILDQGSNNVFFPGTIIIDSKTQTYYPTGPNGGVTLTSAADETHGTIVEIIPAGTITNPFSVDDIYIYNQDGINKNYQIKLYYGASDTLFSTLMNHSGVATGISLAVDNIIFPPNTKISASIAVQDGASKIAKILVGYFEY